MDTMCGTQLRTFMIYVTRGTECIYYHVQVRTNTCVNLDYQVYECS